MAAVLFLTPRGLEDRSLMAPPITAGRLSTAEQKQASVAEQKQASGAKIVPQLTDGNFASVWINGFDGGLVVCVRDGKFPAARRLRQAITLTIHR